MKLKVIVIICLLFFISECWMLFKYLLYHYWSTTDIYLIILLSLHLLGNLLLQHGQQCMLQPGFRAVVCRLSDHWAVEKVYTSSKTYFHKVENIVAGINKIHSCQCKSVICLQCISEWEVQARIGNLTAPVMDHGECSSRKAVW